MTAKQVMKMLKEHGWQEKDQKGSHKQFMHPSKPGKVTVPVHGKKELPPGLLKAIKRQAGLL